MVYLFHGLYNDSNSFYKDKLSYTFCYDTTQSSLFLYYGNAVNVTCYLVNENSLTISSRFSYTPVQTTLSPGVSGTPSYFRMGVWVFPKINNSEYLGIMTCQRVSVTQSSKSYYIFATTFEVVRVSGTATTNLHFSQTKIMTDSQTTFNFDGETNPMFGYWVPNSGVICMHRTVGTFGSYVSRTLRVNNGVVSTLSTTLYQWPVSDLYYIYGNGLYTYDGVRQKTLDTSMSGSSSSMMSDTIVSMSSTNLYVYNLDLDTLSITLELTYSIQDSYRLYQDGANTIHFKQSNFTDNYLLDDGTGEVIKITRRELDYHKTLDATATASNILYGKTAYISTGKTIGTMPNNGSISAITPTTTNITKPYGYYSSNIVINGDANLLPENIKSGVTIFGVTGTYTGT